MPEISAPGFASRATPGDTGSGPLDSAPDPRELARFDREVALRAAAIAALAAVVLAGALIGLDLFLVEPNAPFPDNAANTIVLIPATVLGAIISVWGARSVERRRGGFTPLVPLTTLALGLAVSTPYLVLPVVTTVGAGHPSRRAIVSLVIAVVIWTLVGLAYRRATRLPDTATRRIAGRSILVLVALLVAALLCTTLAAPMSFYAFLLLTPGYAIAPFLFVGLFAWAGILAGRDRRGAVPGLAVRTFASGTLIFLALLCGAAAWVGFQRVATRELVGLDLIDTTPATVPLIDLSPVRMLALIVLVAALLALLARRTAGTAAFLVMSALLALIIVPLSFHTEPSARQSAPAMFSAGSAPGVYDEQSTPAPSADPENISGSRSSVLDEAQSKPGTERHYDEAQVADGTLVPGIDPDDLHTRFADLVQSSARAVDPAADPKPDIQTVSCAEGKGVSYVWNSDTLSAGADNLRANALALVKVGQVWNAAGHNLHVFKVDHLYGVRSSVGIGQNLRAQQLYDHVLLGMSSICVSAR
ncbi:hypothetical protein M2390_000229 [Mycetocola sp. BIGb0189]|uniref:hypothetical protein n=1 Tax=Mycetocola sp. BIGb0189 TaxID=2940604 RepID=UPI002167AF99|nr:hypothetical protein [Mycetocola sp. BIGb0189]MCS4275071.1 hypothetical protein [Mycetocola sp. BIGb0189]